MQIFLRLTALIIPCAGIVSCATTGVTGSSATQHMAAIRVQRLAVSECKNKPSMFAESPESPAIALALAPAIINPAIDLIGAALVNASGKNSQVVTTDTRYTGYFYTYSYPLRSIEKEALPSPSMVLNDSIKCFRIAPAYPKLLRSDQAKFALKIAVVSSTDRTAVAVLPLELTYPAALGDRSDAVLTATIDIVGSDGKAIGSAVLALNAKPQQDVRSTEDLAGSNSGWIANPVLSDSLKTLISSYEATRKAIEPQLVQFKKKSEGGKKLDSADAQAQAELSRQRDANEQIATQVAKNTPVTLHATLTETRTYNEFLAAVGEAISTQKSQISKAITDTYLPAARTPAEQATQISAVGSYWAKRYAFEQAYQAFLDASPTDKPLKKAAAVQAKFDALAAAATASVSLPASDELKVFLP